MQKRILFLGGSFFQIPPLKYAKEQGHYVITCDYLPDNPGHKYADEYHNVSTTDMESVLELAKKLKIDGIVAYASDPSAPTAAYVGNKLGLPSNPYESVRILANKDLYRDFLRKNGFNAPQSISFKSGDDISQKLTDLKFPLMVKPVDSCGSKGVNKVESIDNISEALDYALSFSKSKKCIIEEFIKRVGPQIHGDGFVKNGQLEFVYLGEHFFSKTSNPFVPVSTMFPSKLKIKKIEEITAILQSIISALGFKNGAVNIEVVFDQQEKIYVMELGPRNGGNMVPQIIHYATGYDMTEMTVLSALNSPDYQEKKYRTKLEGYYAYYVIHSLIDGILDSIKISKKLKENVIEKHIFKKYGDMVCEFTGANCALGILLLRFESREEMDQKIYNMKNHIEISLIRK